MYTVVSLLPFPIREVKAGQIPPDYSIEESKGKDDPKVIHLNDAAYGIYLDADRGTLPQVITSKEVARGLIEDFNVAQMEFVPGSSVPGLFAVPGHVTPEDVKKLHSKELGTAWALQVAWFYRLVRKADDDYKVWNSSRVISDPQRHAARILGLKKDWAYTAEELQTCPACASTVKPQVAVCPSCRCILDKERAKTLEFAKVG